MMQFMTSLRFISIYFFVFGYFMVFTLPICIRMTIEPNKTPLRSGFSKIVSDFLLLFKEYS